MKERIDVVSMAELITRLTDVMEYKR